MARLFSDGAETSDPNKFLQCVNFVPVAHEINDTTGGLNHWALIAGENDLIAGSVMTVDLKKSVKTLGIRFSLTMKSPLSYNNYGEMNPYMNILSIGNPSFECWSFHMDNLGYIMANKQNPIEMWKVAITAVTNPIITSAPIRQQQKNWIQIAISQSESSDGFLAIYINGQQVLYWTGITNEDPNYDLMSIVRFCVTPAIKNNYVYIDDIAINDDSGTDSNNFVPPQIGKIGKIQLPNGNGYISEWIGSDGNSADNFEMVNNFPVDPTKYIEVDVAGKSDFYTIEPSGLPTTATILNIIREGSVCNPEGNGGLVYSKIYVDSDHIVVGGVALDSTSPMPFTIASAINPATGHTWTVGEADAIQIGVVSEDQS